MRLQKILIAILSVETTKMENAKPALMWAPIALVAGVPLWFFSKNWGLYPFLCWQSAFIIWWGWSRYTYFQHRAMARSIFWALTDAGFIVRVGGIYGPKFEIATGVAGAVMPDEAMKALLR